MCVCVCVCVVDGEGNRMFTSRAVTVVQTTVYLTSYSDGLTGFLESLLPPRCHSGLKNVLHDRWLKRLKFQDVWVGGTKVGGEGGAAQLRYKSSDLTVAGSSSKSENIFSVKKLMALLTAPGALFLLLVRFFAGELTLLLLLLLLIMTVIQWNRSTIFTSRGITALKKKKKMKGTSPLGTGGGGGGITAFMCVFL